MISVLVASSGSRLNAGIKQRVWSYLSNHEQKKFLAFRSEVDAHHFLLGRYLLLKGLERFAFPLVSLRDINYSVAKKPYINHAPYFNISHSGGYVVCAMSHSIELGIDIERKKCIDIEDFKYVFSSCEIDSILGAVDRDDAFFSLWTQKEALIKADGGGFNLNVKAIAIENSKSMINGQPFHLKRLSIAPEYVAHIACAANFDIHLDVLDVDHVYCTHE